MVQHKSNVSVFETVVGAILLAVLFVTVIEPQYLAPTLATFRWLFVPDAPTPTWFLALADSASTQIEHTMSSTGQGLPAATQIAIIVGFVAVGAVVMWVKGFPGMQRTNQLTTGIVATGKAARKQGKLPRTFPAHLAQTVEDVLTVRGGVDTDGGPKYWVERGACVATPLYWQLPVDYAPGADPDGLKRMLPNIADRLARINMPVDPTLEHKPLSIMINNPTPPTFPLADYWNAVKALPQNELLSAGAVKVEAGKMVLAQLSHDDYFAGWLITGKMGAGKTQFALSTLLTLCMANSPKRFSLYIGDIKRADTHWLKSLPHLAAPIATSADEIADILAGMVAEMLRRASVSDTQPDVGYNTIGIYIDEVASLLETAGERKDEIISNLTLLSQTGRALGMIVILATQRVIQIDTAVFANLNRRCVLKSAKVADSNHAIGCAESTGHLLPSGAVSIHESGDADGEVVRGLFVGKTTNSAFGGIIAPFLADIRQRWLGHAPVRLRIAKKEKPVKAVEVEPVEVEGANAEPVAAIDTLDALIARYGVDLMDAWFDLANNDQLTGKAIGRVYKDATGKSMSGTDSARLRDAIRRHYID